MARVRSPNRDKAFEIYKENDGTITNREIANILGISEKTISGWKSKDNWIGNLKGVLQKEIRSTPKEKRNKGGQLGNKNATGPPKNKNAEKHGFFSRYLPEDTLNIIQEIRFKDPLDILWENIQIQYAAIIRAQTIMFVESKEEMIKELKKSRVKTKDRKTDKASANEEDKEFEYEFQFAWDRQATFLNAQSRAMSELRSLIKQYDETLNINWDLATEEQKARIEVLKSKIVNNEKAKEDKIDEYFAKLEEQINVK